MIIIIIIIIINNNNNDNNNNNNDNYDDDDDDDDDDTESNFTHSFSKLQLVIGFHHCLGLHPLISFCAIPSLRQIIIILLNYIAQAQSTDSSNN